MLHSRLCVALKLQCGILWQVAFGAHRLTAPRNWKGRISLIDLAHPQRWKPFRVVSWFLRICQPQSPVPISKPTYLSIIWGGPTERDHPKSANLPGLPDAKVLSRPSQALEIEFRMHGSALKASQGGPWPWAKEISCFAVGILITQIWLVVEAYPSEKY